MREEFKERSRLKGLWPRKEVEELKSNRDVYKVVCHAVHLI